MQARLDRQQAQSDSRRKGVLDAARCVFERLGIEGASIREIAREAGYTAGAIYSYFESKEAIYGALLAESLERLNAAVGAAGQDGAGPADLLEAKAGAWFGFFAASPRDLDLVFYLVQGMYWRTVIRARCNSLKVQASPGWMPPRWLPRKASNSIPHEPDQAAPWIPG